MPCKRVRADRRRDHRALLHLDALQEQRRAEVRADECSEAVERLAEGQPEVAALRRSERSGERVRRDLEDRDPARQHEQAEQHHFVDFQDSRRAA